MRSEHLLPDLSSEVDMAAPFDSGDMIKRSLFGAIFGFNKRGATANASRSRANSYDNPDQPGPSWASLPPSQQPVTVEAGPSSSSFPSSSLYHASSSSSYSPHHLPLPPPAPFHHPPLHTDPSSVPLPVLTSQCPFSHNRGSFNSLVHHGPRGPPPPPSFPYDQYPVDLPPPPQPAVTPVPNPYERKTPSKQYLLHPANNYKTKADIYREIVHECEEFERSANTTPIMESGPTSPCLSRGGGPPPLHQWPSPPSLYTEATSLTELTSGLSMVDAPVLMGEVAPLPPPPPPLHLHAPPQTMVDLNNLVPGLAQHLGEGKPLISSPISLEELIKFVVHAVKETTTGTKKTPESDPEEILRRKRHMNNEAAARYRKRQREVKEQQHQELEGLLTRNSELKATVSMMEAEVEGLKNAVLQNGIVLPKAEDGSDITF